MPSPQPDSPSGWSDLPSDTEDTFFFTPDETEDFRREKRRRLIEQTREERLKARMEEDDVDDDDEENQEDEDVWGGSDEEVRQFLVQNSTQLNNLKPSNPFSLMIPNKNSCVEPPTIYYHLPTLLNSKCVYWQTMEAINVLLSCVDDGLDDGNL